MIFSEVVDIKECQNCWERIFDLGLSFSVIGQKGQFGPKLDETWWKCSPTYALDISWNFGQKISITIRVINVLSHLDYLSGTCFLGHPVCSSWVEWLIFWCHKKYYRVFWRRNRCICIIRLNYYPFHNYPPLTNSIPSSLLRCMISAGSMLGSIILCWAWEISTYKMFSMEKRRCPFWADESSDLEVLKRAAVRYRQSPNLQKVLGGPKF